MRRASASLSQSGSAYQRARPSFEEPLLTLSTYSFPSGHAAAATLLYGVIVCVIVYVRARQLQ